MRAKPDAASIGQAWFELKHPGKCVPSPILVRDTYLVGAPPFLSKAQRDLVSDWYRSKVSANAEYTDAVTGAAKAFVLIGALNASAAGIATGSRGSSNGNRCRGGNAPFFFQKF